jgi:hypothetical protein
VPEAVEEAQPWAEPAEAAVVQPSVVRVAEAVRPWEAQAAAEAVRPWEAQAAAEVQRAAEPAEEEVQLSVVRVAAAQPSAAQAAVLARPWEAGAVRPSAELLVRSGQQVVLRPVRR